MITQIETYGDRTLWLAGRRRGIGASEAAAVLGESPWQSPYSLWAEKTGEIELNAEANEAMEWGLALEGPIFDAYLRRSKQEGRLAPSFTIYRNEKYPHQFASLDAFQRSSDGGPDIPVQIKTAGIFKRNEWEDDIPLIYQIQVQQEMAIADADREILVVLFGGQTMKWFEVQRHDGFIAELKRQVDEFWDRVLTKNPPPVDGSESTTEALKRLYRATEGTVTELPTSMIAWADQLEAARAAKKAAEADEKLAKNHLADAMGVHETGLLPDGRRVKFTQVDKAAYQVKASSYRTMSIK